MEEAQKKYIEWSEKVMAKNNFDPTHPDKKKIELEYQKCIDKKLKEGITLAQI